MAVVESAAAGAAAGAAGGAGGAGAAGAGAATGAQGAAGGSDQLQQALREAAKRGARNLPDDGDRGPVERLAHAGLALLSFVLLLIVLVLMPLILLFGFQQPALAGGGGQGYPVGSGVPEVYWSIYVTAASQYQVSPYLLASIHKQESGFSRNPTVRSGANGSGAMGPMQFLASTWRGYETAFVPIKAARPKPGSGVLLDRRSLPSCQQVPVNRGCVYDDFDAIAGAAAYLSASNADTSLTSAGTRAAVCAYIGACSEVDNCTGSINQYCQVLPRARAWEQTARTAPTSGTVPVGGAKAIVEHAVTIAQRFSSSIYVCSDYRPGSVTTGNNVSDHASNDATRAARDIAARGRDCIAGPPSPRLDQAAVAIGAFFGRSYQLGTTVRADTFDWHGYRIQIIWRTPEWGGHMGHIHVGAREL